jgi:hypothetical protein
MPTETTTAHFSVHGDFITDHFRGLVREGNWRKAIDDAIASFAGMTREIAEQILSGKAKLEGINNVTLVEDDAYLDPQWVTNLYYTYTSRLFVHNHKIYIPYHEVDGLDRDDAQRAMDLFGWEKIPWESDMKSQFTYDRLRTYMNDMNKDVAVYDPAGTWMLCKESTPDYPAWITCNEFVDMVQANTPEDVDERIEAGANVVIVDDALTDILADNEASGSDSIVDTFLSNMEKADQALDNIDALKAQVKEQADRLGGWMTLSDKRSKQSYTIPKNPFLRWCLSDNPKYHSIKWSCLSTQGMKMGGDDPNHTDWWLFTDIPLSEANNHNSAANAFFFRERHRVHEEMTGSNIKCLVDSGHQGLTQAPVLFFNSPTQHDVPHNSIVVIPNASPDYEMLAHRAAKQNCIIITETGGALCHLATVGREFGLQLYLLPDASSILKGATIAAVNTSTMQLTVRDYMDHEFTMLLKRKLTGLHYM